MGNSPQQTAQYPRNTWELIKYIAKQIPQRLLKALPMTVAFGAGSWLLHTILLVYSNEGFSPDTWLGRNILNVQGRLISSTLLWAMAGAVIPMVISFIKRGGNPVKSVTSIIKLPGEILQTNKTSGGKFLPMICLACAVTLFINGILSGMTSLIAGGIIANSVLAFMTGRGSIFIQMLRMMTQDVQLYVLKKKNLQLNNDHIMMIIGVSGSTMLAIGILKILPLPWFLMILLNYLWIVMTVLGIVLLFNNNKIPKQFMFGLMMIGAAVVLSEVKAFADDGGWSEAGGTLGGWLTSEGAFTATLSGLPPAIGGLIGTYVSSIISGLTGGFGDFFGGSDPTGPQTMGPQPVQPEPVEPPTQQPVEPATTTQPPQNPPVDPKEQERIRLEQERIRQEQEQLRQEFEAKRRQKMQEQQEMKRKAQEELKRIQAEKKRQQDYINGLCKKYDTTPEHLVEKIKEKMGENAAEAASWNSYATKLAYAEAAAKITLVAADTAIDGLANATGPFGKGVRAVYKVSKGVASSVAEDGLSVKSVASGAVKGGGDAANDYIKSNYVKAAVTIGTETAGGYISKGTEGAVKGLASGVLNVTTGAITDKIAGKLGGADFGNELKPTIFNKDGTATVTMNSAGKWISKTIGGADAIKFVDKKIGQQLTSSATKGANGLLNELVLKPALGLD